jgi:hypothetical protein
VHYWKHIQQKRFETSQNFNQWLVINTDKENNSQTWMCVSVDIKETTSPMKNVRKKNQNVLIFLISNDIWRKIFLVGDHCTISLVQFNCSMNCKKFHCHHFQIFKIESSKEE